MEKEEFEQEWNKKVQEATRIARWKEDIQGYFVEPEREPLSAVEEETFISEFSDFLNKAARFGKTVADFYEAVNKKIKDESRKAINDDEKTFYLEIEAEVDRERIKKNKKISAGDISRGVTFEMKINRKYRKFIKRLNELLDMYSELDQINIQINIIKGNLKNLESQYREEENQSEEERLRGEISDMRYEISQAVKEKSELQKRMNKENKFYNNTVTEIRRELQSQKRYIEQKWGGQVKQLLQNRQSAIEQLNKTDKKAPEHSEERSKIMEKINDYELELQKLKEKIIKYKSKHWVFLFEKYLGHESSPGALNERKEITSVDPLLGMVPYSEYEETVNEIIGADEDSA